MKIVSTLHIQRVIELNYLALPIHFQGNKVKKKQEHLENQHKNNLDIFDNETESNFVLKKTATTCFENKVHEDFFPFPFDNQNILIGCSCISYKSNVHRDRVLLCRRYKVNIHELAFSISQMVFFFWTDTRFIKKKKQFDIYSL